ncbi:hypothetical protein P154DRAFT_233655 [Amniculicola lignicola CBS 123094]|uniref:Uncharacterized protein n=1 Tax=Amniculicola lignicola CBS 123094 TaxID=1392246 RepID=A0A6A5WE54_9PLEO|nr:hypothetical protein P154DRAFT_233655 [Amniculicola lignicola CBS 123094]
MNEHVQESAFPFQSLLHYLIPAEVDDCEIWRFAGVDDYFLAGNVFVPCLTLRYHKSCTVRFRRYPRISQRHRNHADSDLRYPRIRLSTKSFKMCASMLFDLPTIQNCPSRGCFHFSRFLLHRGSPSFSSPISPIPSSTSSDLTFCSSYLVDLCLN